MCGSATLEELDHYLRTIWLECCGHLSQFTIGGMLYDRPGADSGYLGVCRIRDSARVRDKDSLL